MLCVLKTKRNTKETEKKSYVLFNKGLSIKLSVLQDVEFRWQAGFGFLQEL